MSDITAIVVPRVSVNDDTVALVEYTVPSGAYVTAGSVVCVVETTKTSFEVTTHVSGVLKWHAQPGELVDVGATIAFVGPSIDAIERAVTEQAHTGVKGLGPIGIKATPRALAMCRAARIDVAEVARSGVRGTVKERDVEQYMAHRVPPGHGTAPAKTPLAEAPSIPTVLSAYLAPPQTLSRHEMNIISGLQATRDGAIGTTLDYRLPLQVIAERLEQAQRRGTLVTLQHLAIAALGRVLPRFPRLMSFRAGDRLYTYAAPSVAFVVRTPEGRLFTPVVRDPGTLSVAGVAKACVGAAMRAMRDRIAARELEGASFTVSHVAERGVLRFEALPNRFQSAILAIAGEHEDGVTLTLTYDHALCDGSYAAAFMKELHSTMETLAV